MAFSFISYASKLIKNKNKNKKICRISENIVSLSAVKISVRMEDSNKQQNAAETAVQKNFLEEIIENDLASGRVESVMTRFPPEPNGYLHIGHAKSICLNFGLARKYGGRTNLRFDDTNPVKEDTEYVDSIKEDIKWLGFDWAGEYYASDYFQQLYDWAVVLIKKGLAYVDDQTQEEIRQNRGTVQQPGVDSPWRNRSVEENLDLFERMKNGEFPDGSKVLRAKIDMAHPNMMFRDPLMYRIIHAHHHRTGDKWCIYPMYDYAHGQCDSTPPYRRQVVHLPDVRLCPRAVRLDRAHHPFDMHLRVRRTPSPLRLVHRAVGHFPLASV